MIRFVLVDRLAFSVPVKEALAERDLIRQIIADGYAVVDASYEHEVHTIQHIFHYVEFNNEFDAALFKLTHL